MRNPTTRNQVKFLRALAAVNPEDSDGWWPSEDLIRRFPADFPGRTVQSLSATGRQCVARGFAVSRTVGPKRHCWTEYRITARGFTLVSDSCLGGGLTWGIRTGVPRCPACLSTPAELAAAGTPVRRGTSEIPAHPVPARQAAKSA
jgi:hypothetical protein